MYYKIYSLTNSNDGEGTQANLILVFDSNGFTVGGNQYYANIQWCNTMTWAWKANGGTTSSNNDGNLTSTVQDNTTAGFSIVTWKYRRWFKSSVGHGLGVDILIMFITKNMIGITLLIGKYIMVQILR